MSPSLDGETDEPSDEALAVVPDQLARPVHVGESQRAGADAEDVVVEEMVVLARGLVDAVDVGGPDEMALVHGQPVGPAINLPRAGVDDADARIVLAAGLEHRQLRAAVDVEIRVRIAHAVDVADLPGKVCSVTHRLVPAVVIVRVGRAVADYELAKTVADIKQSLS